MKKIILGGIIGVALMALYSFGQHKYSIGKGTAEVEQTQGLYVFSESKPVLEYEYLGTVSSVSPLEKDFHYIKNRLIRQTKRKYPEADGIILLMESSKSNRADVIKFKD